MERRCASCNEYYPATIEYFYKANNKIGLRARCKICMNHQAGEHRKKRDEDYVKTYNSIERAGLLKTCGKCKKELPATLEYYFKHSIGKYGLRSKCKRCFSEQTTKNMQKEESRQRNKEYGRKRYHENKEHHAERYKKYYQENQEYHLARAKKYRKNNPEKRREAEMLYVKNNIDKVRQKWKKQGHNKRANKQQAVATMTLGQWVKCQEQFNGACAYCGVKANELSQDHFQALSRGGKYTHYNIVPACKSCNSSKNNKSFFDWYPQQGFYSKQREKKILKYLNIKDQKQQLTLAF